MGIFSKTTKEKKEDVAQKESTKPKASSTKKKKASKKDSVVSVASAYGVVISPIVTEKSHKAAADNKYTFRVAKAATKQQVKKVIEEMYSVSVESVNMVVVKPKKRTVKYDRGYQKLYKKAIVTVREGDVIAIFEGV